METTATGRIATSLMIENAADLYNAEKGLVSPKAIHRVEVTEALVDREATYIGLPLGLIRQLGFDKPYRTRMSRTADGSRPSGVYGPVRVTVLGRIFHGDVSEVEEGCPVVIGQIALGGLDLVVDPSRGWLIPNPAHGGEHIIEMY